MLLHENTFWALLRVNFILCVAARAKMGLSRAQKIFFIPTDINSIVLF